MKINWKHFAGSIFALLGFSGCENIGLGPAMYGQPSADYKLIGDVEGPDGERPRRPLHLTRDLSCRTLICCRWAAVFRRFSGAAESFGTVTNTP